MKRLGLIVMAILFVASLSLAGCQKASNEDAVEAADSTYVAVPDEIAE